MKKLKSLFLVALLALGANLSAQETDDKGAGAAGSGTETAGAAGTGTGTAGTAATASTIGGIATSTVVIGAVAVGVAAAIIANNDDDDVDPIPCRTDQEEVGGVCQCPAGQVEINGLCQVQPPEFECTEEAGDTYNADLGFCEGVRITTTLSGTVTVTVPINVTYTATPVN